MYASHDLRSYNYLYDIKKNLSIYHHSLSLQILHGTTLLGEYGQHLY